MIKLPNFRSYKSFDNPENTIRIDWDGTIVKLQGHQSDISQAEIRKGAKESLDKLHADGRKIIIWTSHKPIDQIERWLRANHIPFDGIEEKPRFLKQIDDKVVEATQPWDKIMEEIPKPPRQPSHHSYSYHTLKFKAKEAVREFLDFLEHIKCPLVGLGNYEAMAHALVEPEHIIVFGGLKSEAKAQEKVANEYGGNWARLLDILRATVVMDTPECLYEALDEAEEYGELVRKQDKTNDPVMEPHILTNWKMPCGIIVEVKWHLKPDFLRWRQLAGEIPQEHLAEIQDTLATKQLDMDEDREPEDLMDKTNEGLDEKAYGEKRQPEGSEGAHFEEAREDTLRHAENRRHFGAENDVMRNARVSRDREKIRREDPNKYVKDLESDGEKRVRRTYGSTRSAYSDLFSGKRQQNLQKVPGKLTLFGSKRRLAGKMETRGPSVPKEMFPQKAKERRYGKSFEEKFAGVDRLTPEEMERAEKVDLVRLPEALRDNPGGTHCSNCVFFDIAKNYCKHHEVKMTLPYPGKEMCCKEWDSPGTERLWEDEKALGTNLEPGHQPQFKVGQPVTTNEGRGGKVSEVRPSEEYGHRYLVKYDDAGWDEKEERHLKALDGDEKAYGRNQITPETEADLGRSAESIKQSHRFGKMRRHPTRGKLVEAEYKIHEATAKYGFDPKERRDYDRQWTAEKAFKHSNISLPKLERNVQKDKENRFLRKLATKYSLRSGKTVKAEATRNRMSPRHMQRNPNIPRSDLRSGESHRAAEMRHQHESEDFTIDEKGIGKVLSPQSLTLPNQTTPNHTGPDRTLPYPTTGKAMSYYNETSGGSLVQTSLGPKIPRREHVHQPLPEKRKMRHNTDRMEQIIHENEGGYGPSVRPVDKRESLFTRTKACGGFDIPMFGSKSSHTAAVELGHYGGKVGGPARARKLSAARRSEIAKMGGKARQRMIGK